MDKNEVEARAMAEGWVDAEGNVTAAGTAMATQASSWKKQLIRLGHLLNTQGK